MLELYFGNEGIGILAPGLRHGKYDDGKSPFPLVRRGHIIIYRQNDIDLRYAIKKGGFPVPGTFYQSKKDRNYCFLADEGYGRYAAEMELRSHLGTCAHQ